MLVSSDTKIKNEDFDKNAVAGTYSVLSKSSVADPGCFSRIPDLGSRIQKQQQKRGVKNFCCHNFLCSYKFHKIANYFSFEVLKKKIWANFQRNIELTQKIVTRLSKIWIWYPGSEIQDPDKNLFRIPDPGVKKAPDPGSATLSKSDIFLRTSPEGTPVWHMPQGPGFMPRKRYFFLPVPK
jgi:hypothetical protein